MQQSPTGFLEARFVLVEVRTESLRTVQSTLAFTVGRATAKAVSRRPLVLSLRRTGIDPRSVYVRTVVDKVALIQVFLPSVLFYQ